MASCVQHGCIDPRTPTDSQQTDDDNANDDNDDTENNNNDDGSELSL